MARSRFGEAKVFSRGERERNVSLDFPCFAATSGPGSAVDGLEGMVSPGQAHSSGVCCRNGGIFVDRRGLGVRVMKCPRVALRATDTAAGFRSGSSYRCRNGGSG